MTRFSRRHYRLLSNGGLDTAEQIADRLRYSAAAERAIRDREELFPVLTADNAAEAIAWQERRIRELTS